MRFCFLEQEVQLSSGLVISGKMEDDMVNKFSKFKLIPQEADGVEIVVTDVEQRQDECERSLLGRVWGNKTANFIGLRNTLTPLWCHKGEMQIVELSANFFQFIFSSREEKDRVLMKRPWIFDSQFVVVHQWTPKLTVDDPCFRSVQVWLQVKGLPNHWSSKSVGWKIGRIFSKCLNVCLLENGSKEGRVLKLLVEIKLDCPLLRGSMIKMGSEKYWLDFRYEQLPVFCFYCGICGHQERACVRKIDDPKKGCILEDQYGDWIRGFVPTGGRRGNLGEGKSGNQGRGQGKGHVKESVPEDPCQVLDNGDSGKGNERTEGVMNGMKQIEVMDTLPRNTSILLNQGMRGTG